MGVQNPNSTAYEHPDEPNLLNLHKAMKYNNTGEPQVRVHVDGISLEGDVIVDKVKLWDGTNNLTFDLPSNDGETAPWSLPTENHNMVFNGSTWDRMRGTIADGVLTQISNDYLAISKDTNANSDSNRIFVSATGTVELGTTTLAALENISATVSGTVALDANTLSALENVGVTGTVTVQDGGGSITVDGSVSATVSGTVELGSTTLSALENINATISDGGGSITVDGTLNVTQTPGSYNEVHFWPSSLNTQLDTAGRLRVSTAGQNWWFVPAVDKDGDLRYSEKTSGTSAAVMWIQYLASVDISAGTDSNGYAIRASRRRHKLRPATAHQWYGIANWCGRQTNTAKRLGMFTPYNGIFYELLGDDLYAVIRRRLVDGTLVEKRIKRSAFNVDKLDGTGPTGYNFDTSKTIAITGWVSTTPVTAGLTTVYNVVLSTPGITLAQWPLGIRVNTEGLLPTTYNNAPMITAVNEAQGRVTLTYTNVPGVFSSVGVGARLYHDGFLNEYSWFFDFNGSRTNRVRFCIQGTEGPMVLHYEDFGGQLGSQYENAPALMERAEVVNTGTVNHLSALKVSGTAFNTEAEVELNPGFGVAANNNGVAFVKQQTQEFAILGVGLRAGEPYQRADLQIQRVQITDLGNVNPQNSGLFYWRLLFNPTLGGDFAGNGSATEHTTGKSSRYWKFTTSTTFSGGIELFSGYAQATTTVEVQTALNFLNLGSNIDYTDADKVVLVVKQLVGGTDNANIVAAINFIEAL